MTLSGATLRARDAGSDFALVEINQNIPDEWDRVFAGWDRSGITPEFTVGIHHPSGDVMKVCRDDDQPTQTINGGAQTWEITTAGGGWEWGVTEPGSSGPLYLILRVELLVNYMVVALPVQEQLITTY